VARGGVQLGEAGIGMVTVPIPKINLPIPVLIEMERENVPLTGGLSLRGLSYAQPEQAHHCQDAVKRMFFRCHFVCSLLFAVCFCCS
jgi:hypothetical protein